MKRFILCISVFMLTWLNLAAQQSLVIENNEAGKLSKEINKNGVLNITSLKVSGAVNDKDMKFLEKLSNLECLDLENATFEKGYFPLLPNLKKLILPEKCDPNVSSKDCSLHQYIQKNTTIRNIKMSLDMARKLSLPNVKILTLYNSADVRNADYYRSLSGKILADTLYVTEINHSKHGDSYEYGQYVPNYIVETAHDNRVTLNIYDTRINFKGINYLPVRPDYQKFRDCSGLLNLSDVLIIPDYFFQNSPMTYLIPSMNIQYIGDYAFANCINLKKLLVISNNPLTIGNSFDNCSSLDTVEFANRAKVTITSRNPFFGCTKLKHVSFMGEVEGIDVDPKDGSTCIMKLDENSELCIDKAKNVTFDGKILTSNYFLELNRPYSGKFRQPETQFKQILFTGVPRNMCDRLTYFISDYATLMLAANDTIKRSVESKYDLTNIIDVSRKKIAKTITVDAPGKILSYISIDELAYIDSLTIIGHIYTSDLYLLCKCNQLKYLDLGRCIVTYSPDQIEDQRMREEFANTLLQALGAAADASYIDYKMGTGEYILTKALTIGLQSKSDVKGACDVCFIPRNAFSNMQFLKTVILPYTASYIESGAFNRCNELETVELPPYLKKIEHSFDNCTSLKNIDFPNTLVYLQGFYNCTSLTRVDLSQCTFEKNANRTNNTYWAYVFKGCSNLTELYLPKGITKIDEGSQAIGNTKVLKIYIQSVMNYLNIEQFNDSVEFHFASPEPPSEIHLSTHSGKPKFFCPKGSITAYYIEIGSSFELKEE